MNKINDKINCKECLVEFEPTLFFYETVELANGLSYQVKKTKCPNCQSMIELSRSPEGKQQW